MLTKSAFYTLALVLITAGLVISSGMGRHHWLDGLRHPEQATLRVLGGAPHNAVGMGRGAAIRFELAECSPGARAHRVTIPFWADSLRRFRGFTQLPLRPEVVHRFADVAWQVDPGCYRVRAQVVDAEGLRVATCEAADTPNSYLEAHQTQNYAFLLDCDAFDQGPPPAGIRLQGILNRAPRLAPLEVTTLPGAKSCRRTRICARAQDPDGDPLRIEWALQSASGRRLAAPTPSESLHRSTDGTRREECITLPANTRVTDVDVDVRDVSGALVSPDESPQDTSARLAGDSSDLLSFEDLYLGDFGLIASSRDHRSVRLQAPLPGGICSPEKCPEHPADRVQSINYWISRDDVLLPPTTDLSRVREGDSVDVEFTIASGCQAMQVDFSSFYAPSQPKHPDSSASHTSQKNLPDTSPTPASTASNTYGAGTHILWNRLPNCRFRIVFRVAKRALPVDQPLIGEELDEKSGSSPAHFRLLDSYAGGEHPCPESPSTE